MVMRLKDIMKKDGVLSVALG